jgi:cell division protein FtsQ
MTLSLRQVRDQGFLWLSIICAFLLVARLTYSFLANPNNYPINTFKIVANYKHVTREQLETILKHYDQAGFFSIPVKQLSEELNNISWVKTVHVSHLWPDTLKIKVIEKKPVAIWNKQLMMRDGELFEGTPADWQQEADVDLPKLNGPKDQQLDVLQMFQKLSKLLITYGLRANSLVLRDNQSWELQLINGVVLRLGKRDIERRILRFCQAYPVVFVDKIDHLSVVDLRYVHGMAAQWKETNKKAG